MIPFPFPPFKPWHRGLCMGLCMSGSFGLHLAHARHELQTHTRQRPMIPFPLPPVKPWGLCMGLSMGGSFGLHLAHVRFVCGFVCGWIPKLRLVLGSGSGIRNPLCFFVFSCRFIVHTRGIQTHTFSRPTDDKFFAWCRQHGHKNTSEYEFLFQVRVWIWGLIFVKMIRREGC